MEKNSNHVHANHEKVMAAAGWNGKRTENHDGTREVEHANTNLTHRSLVPETEQLKSQSKCSAKKLQPLRFGRANNTELIEKNEFDEATEKRITKKNESPVQSMERVRKNEWKMNDLKKYTWNWKEKRVLMVQRGRRKTREY